MRRAFFSFMVGCFCALAARGDNPMQFREYVQSFDLVFATEEDAQAAAVAARFLPADFTMALSARWDDTNPKHLVTRDLMRKHGIKGTFYLTGLPGPNEQAVAAELAKDGFSLGMHTIGHPFMPARNPHTHFMQFMQNRIQEETVSQSPVNTSVLPFGSWGWDGNPEIASSIGRAMRAAGIIGSPEFMTNREWFAPVLGYNPKAFAMSRVLTPGDVIPDLDKFEAQLAEYLADKETLARHPSITLGVHSLHQEGEGRAKLEEELQRLSGHDDWWYCNQSDYSAYRYEALNCRVETAAEGKVLHVSVSRMEPAELGADVPLWLTVNGAKPQAATGDAILHDGPSVELPHAHHTLPQAIGVADDNGACPLFPNIRLAMVRNDDGWNVSLANDEAAEITEIWLTVRFSGKVETSVFREDVGELPPGQSAARNFPLQTVPDTLYNRCGTPFTVAQLDFTLDGKRCRLYATHLEPAPDDIPVLAADVARFFRFPENGEPDLAALSTPGADIPLTPVAYTPTSQTAPCFIQGPFGNSAYSIVQVLDFIPKKPGPNTLYLNNIGKHSPFWLNGELLSNDNGVFQVELKEGVNRLAFTLRFCTFTLFSIGDSVDSTPFVDFAAIP